MMKLNLIAAVVFAVSAPAMAVNPIHGQVFDKWVSGVYNDHTAAGPIVIERIDNSIYFVQAGIPFEFAIEDVTVVSPVQVKAVAINRSGGIYTFDRYLGQLDMVMPSGQTLRTTRIRDTISAERTSVRKLVGKYTGAQAKPEIKAGFDCNKAGTQIEHMICNDVSVASLDYEVTQKYASLMKMVDDKPFFRQDQRNWIGERNLCQSNQCLVNAYQDRLEQMDLVINYMNKPAEFR